MYQLVLCIQLYIIFELLSIIICIIKGRTEFSLQEHTEKIAETHSKLSNEWMEQHQRKLDAVLESMEARL